MRKLGHILLILLGAIGAFLILSDRSAGAFQTQIESQRRTLSPEEKRGKAFYLRGESSSGQEITAMMGEIEVPATTLTCAGCHGARGEGKTEGGVTAGNMTGLMPRITFGPNRRIGVLGAYIVTIDPEKKLFPARAVWISVD